MTVVQLTKIKVQMIAPLCRVGHEQYFTQLLSLDVDFTMTLNQGHTSKIRITVHI